MKRFIVLTMVAASLVMGCQDSNAENDAPLVHSGNPSDGDTDYRTGDIVEMGSYQQDRQLKDPIKWIVLKSDGDRVLLLSLHLLSSRPWDVSGQNQTYDKSSIRQWLNNDFLSAAFTASETEAIITTELDNSEQHGYGTPAGTNTSDKVFLLSVEEFESYVGNSNYKTAQPTVLAKSEGAYTNGEGNAAWWLRSPGTASYSPAYLSSAGSLGSRAHQATETIIGIRPAIWIKASSRTDR